MKPVKALLLILLCLLLVISTHANAKPRDKKVKLSTAGKIYVPKKIDTIELLETEKFPQKEFGVAFTYTAKNTPLRLTYYIYPIPENISLEFTMFAEFSNIKKEMKYVSQRNGGVFSLLLEEIININDQQTIHTLANIEENGTNYITELYLTSIRNHYIKLRATYPTAASKEFDLRTKTQSFFEQLLNKTQFKSKDKSKTIINLNPDSFNNDDINLSLAMMYGIATRGILPKELIISYPLYLDIYQKTLEITRGLAKEKKLPISTNQEALSLFEVEDAGFLKELIWSVFKRPYWQKPKDLNMKGFEKWTKENELKKITARPTGVEILVKR
jgi:hypothetical protein